MDGDKKNEAQPLSWSPWQAWRELSTEEKVNKVAAMIVTVAQFHGPVADEIRKLKKGLIKRLKGDG